MDTQGWVSFSGALWYPVAVGMDGSTKNLWIFGGNSVSRVGDLPFFATKSCQVTQVTRYDAASIPFAKRSPDFGGLIQFPKLQELANNENVSATLRLGGWGWACGDLGIPDFISLRSLSHKNES